MFKMFWTLIRRTDQYVKFIQLKKKKVEKSVKFALRQEYGYKNNIWKLFKINNEAGFLKCGKKYGISQKTMLIRKY